MTIKSGRFFTAGTHGQKYPPETRGKKRKKQPSRKDEPRPSLPRIDKTTNFDTMTREELMRYREEEAQRMRNEE